MIWAYSVMTVPERLTTTLPKTIASLSQAGFSLPSRIFVDGQCDANLYQTLLPQVGVTIRDHAISVFGSWYLGMLELYLRNPHCDRYVMFQDDLLACKNLRQYLESYEYPHMGYLNLYTMPENLLLSGGKQGWHLSNQLGRGALALAFSREALMIALKSDHMLSKPRCVKLPTKNLDGAVLTAMKQAGWKEYIHNPSLVQHIGSGVSTLGNREWPKADSFPGEDFDALTLQKETA